MPRIFVSLLGGFEAYQNPKKGLKSFPTRKAAALTAYLVTEGPGRQSRDALAAMFWGHVSPAQARHSLRQTLVELRRTLEPCGSSITTVDDTIELSLGCVRLDVAIFERCVRRRSARSLRLACELYRGDFLAGVVIHESGFDIWQTHQRMRLRQLAIEAHELYIDGIADQALALQMTLRLLSIDPLHEWAHRKLIALYAERGQFSTAMQQYELFARLLREELGIEPERQTQDLLRRLLIARSVPTAGPALQYRSPGRM